jgi:hypothetical protein
MNFAYKNILFQKHEKESWTVVKGEIHNGSSANYHAVAFRIIIFIKGQHLINMVVTVNNFSAGKTKTFERNIQTLDHTLIDSILRYEIHAEGSY